MMKIVLCRQMIATNEKEVATMLMAAAGANDAEIVLMVVAKASLQR